MKNPLVSIVVVDYKKNNPYLIENLNAISKQSYQKYETILVTDYKNDLKYPKLRKKFYNKYVGPAQKRDAGANMANGEILIFLDDDAYPDKNWLKEIVSEFGNSHKIVGVGGPGVTPPNVPWTEELSGWASASPIGSGKYLYRFLPTKRQIVEDYPSMNLAVLKKDFLGVGGFDSNYWPGEDTKLCLDLINKTNKKIIYTPKALVYHHRRPVLISHLRQNGNFGLHRGFFARVLPQTSLKPIYFLPSLFLIYVLLLPTFVIANLHFNGAEAIPAIVVSSMPIILYLTLLTLNSLWIYNYKHSHPRSTIYDLQNYIQPLLSIPVIFITHLWYGLRFLQGLLFTDKLVQ